MDWKKIFNWKVGVNMRKLILNWLFGIDNVEKYMSVLSVNINYHDEHIATIKEHLKTLEEAKQLLNIIEKLIVICKNHGINIDEEIKQIKL